MDTLTCTRCGGKNFRHSCVNCDPDYSVELAAAKEELSECQHMVEVFMEEIEKNDKDAELLHDQLDAAREELERIKRERVTTEEKEKR